MLSGKKEIQEKREDVEIGGEKREQERIAGERERYTERDRKRREIQGWWRSSGGASGTHTEVAVIKE